MSPVSDTLKRFLHGTLISQEINSLPDRLAKTAASSRQAIAIIVAKTKCEICSRMTPKMAHTL